MQVVRMNPGAGLSHGRAPFCTSKKAAILQTQDHSSYFRFLHWVVMNHWCHTSQGSQVVTVDVQFSTALRPCMMVHSECYYTDFELVTRSMNSGGLVIVGPSESIICPIPSLSSVLSFQTTP